MTENPPVVLITGASQGIGKASAEAFLRAGYRVALAARSADKLDAIARDWPTTALAIPCDVTDPESVAALFDTIVAQFGRLDVVFNNAGAAHPTTEIGDISFDDWRRVLSVNLDGSFLIARGAFRVMRAQSPRGGRIINNGSVSAQVPRIGGAAYSASKAAITGLTKVIALDGRAHDIASSQIDIGNAASDMTDVIAAGIPQADGSLRAEPVMDVTHVTDALLYMAGLPLAANVQFMTVMATKMPFIGRG
ncbi:SDR family oxidoreductase [Roseicitreum antarcticum]|uniref:NADP-dependent 3-hydroxy acid dehydrogenase YdfG n=1 Tax=Roseicitreum antarcticum TaxID=564137 RepID=A0A1H2XFJ1_9RHOB|nr:SDR family oxidoreductase [Roseicitreum antarcticum]SDW91610.1 NADP-dependent 3-hydroxy acid dehydrogenase YdfG [Roseicitreum antarcticum]